MINRAKISAQDWTALTEPFQFISPLPLEECVERLQGASAPTPSTRFSNVFKIEITQTDPDDYQFVLHNKVGRNMLIDVVGTLERAGAKTYVHGRGQISKITIAVLLIILLVHLSILSQVPQGILMLGLDFLVVAGLWSIMVNERRRLVEWACKSLGKLDNDFFSAIQQSRKPATPNLTRTFGIICAILLIFSIVYTLNQKAASAELELCANRPAHPRAIVESDINVKALWATSIVADGGLHFKKDSIAIGTGKIFVENCEDIKAFDWASGELLWKSQRTNDWGYPNGTGGQLTIDERHNELYADKLKGGIDAFSLTDSKVLWSEQMPAGSYALPYIDLLADGRVFANGYGRAWYVDPGSGALEPATLTPSTLDGNLPTVVDGIQLVTYKTHLGGKDSTGRRVWQFDGGFYLTDMNIATAGNVVYVMDPKAKVYLLDLHTGQLLGTIQFAPLSDQSERNGPSIVASYNNLLVVYFSDTYNLSVYVIGQ